MTAIRPAQYRGVAEIIRKSGFWDIDEVDAAIILNALDRCGIEAQTKKEYRCGVCGSTDLQRYMRCDHPACPDGRDR